MVSIKGPQRNREAAKRKIEELAEMSTEREHHDWREVCANDDILIFHS